MKYEYGIKQKKEGSYYNGTKGREEYTLFGKHIKLQVFQDITSIRSLCDRQSNSE